MAKDTKKGSTTTADSPNPKAKEFYATTKVSPEMFERLKVEAERQGVSPRAIVRQALASFLAGEKPPVKAESVDHLLDKIEERLVDLDRRVDAVAINAVRASDRVGAIVTATKA
jgi:predicted transcriptional regulator